MHALFLPNIQQQKCNNLRLKENTYTLSNLAIPLKPVAHPFDTDKKLIRVVRLQNEAGNLFVTYFLKVDKKTTPSVREVVVFIKNRLRTNFIKSGSKIFIIIL